MIFVVAVTLLAAGAGAAAARRSVDKATRTAELGLAANLWLILPVVTFFNVARFEYSGEVGIGIAFAYLGLAASLGLAFAASGRLGLENHTRGAFLCASFVTNTGFLGLPFTAALLGYDDLPEAIAYDLAVSAPALLLVAFSIGAHYRHEQHLAERGLRAFLTRNPALYAALAGLAVPDALAPDAAVDASRALLVLMAPIGFFALGVFASTGGRRGFGFPPATAPVLAVSILKLTVPFAVMLACAALIHDVPDAYLVQAAMPTGLNTLLLVSAYRLDREITAGAIVYTTVVVLTWGLIAAALI